MRKHVLVMVALTSAAAAFMAAQAPPPGASTAPKAKKGVTAKEVAAAKKVQEAKTPDDKIAAVEALVTSFADTSFKGWAFDQAAQASDSKGDWGKAITYGDLAIEADPMRFDTMLLVAGELAQHTQKNSLTKDEDLGKAEKYIKQALEIMPTAIKPAEFTISDADWEVYKKDEVADAHKDLGLIAVARQNFNLAATEFKTAVDGRSVPDSVVMARLGNAYNMAGKYSDALAILDKTLALPNLDPRVKAFADQEKATAEKGLKGK